MQVLAAAVKQLDLQLPSSRGGPSSFAVFKKSELVTFKVFIN